MRIWQFKTRNFRVELSAEIEQDPDLSWDDDGEAAAKIDSGEWGNYCFAVRVYGPHGEELAADYLGNSIHADASEFRDHIGLAAKSRADGRNYGAYFTDMVRTAIAAARKAMADLQGVRIRAAA